MSEERDTLAGKLKPLSISSAVLLFFTEFYDKASPSVIILQRRFDCHLDI